MLPQPEHKPDGDPCSRCGEAADRHRAREPRLGQVDTRTSRKRGDDREGRKRKRLDTRKGRGGKHKSKNLEKIVAIDGEGQTFWVDQEGRRTPGNVEGFRETHRYTYLAAVDEDGTLLAEIRNYEYGLSTMQCLDFFLSLGASRCFGFSIGYDLTKILRELPDRTLYRLFRPDLRRPKGGKKGVKPVNWLDYKLNYVRGRFTAARKVLGTTKQWASIAVWDVWRFFSCSFVNALTDWKIADPKALDAIKAMKLKRDTFREEDKVEIEAYCKSECHELARLVRALIEAHEAVEIPLKQFYGAGSTASALLEKLEAKQYIKEPPILMRDAVARAFFGGRFEISRRGPVRMPCWNADISSAYPYEITFLPCLACGTWRHVVGEKAVDKALRDSSAQSVLVHASVQHSEQNLAGWGMFPWRAGKRTKDRDGKNIAGSILFPLTNPGVWVYRSEYLEAQKLSAGVTASEAYVYRTGCIHRPFKDVPELYRERLRIGKEGRGLVLKLGMNSLYGKCAQSVGSHTYQSWVWAGMITSGTRANLLAALGRVKDPWHALMLATDGIFGIGDDAPPMPTPRDTSTNECLTPEGLVHKPLGGWETKRLPGGLHLMRPGIYFPLGDASEKSAKARGVSKKILADNAGRILEAWEKNPGQDFRISGLRRFMGAVSSILDRGKMGLIRDINYGEWMERNIDISYEPGPKRVEVRNDVTLIPWDKPPGGQSAPYDNAVISADAAGMKAEEQILGEQMDGDYLEGGL